MATTDTLHVGSCHPRTVSPVLRRHMSTDRHRVAAADYQNRIIERIRGNLEQNRKSWEDDIRKQTSPSASRRTSYYVDDDDVVDGTLVASNACESCATNSCCSSNAGSEEKLDRVGTQCPKSCIVSRRKHSQNNGITQWTFKVTVQSGSGTEYSLSVRVDATAVHLDRQLKGKVLEEVIELGDSGTVMPETLQVIPSGIDMLTVRLCTKA